MLITNNVLLKYKATQFQMSFMDPSSSAMLGIIDLHHSIMFYLIVVFIFVFWLLARIVASGSGYPYFLVMFCRLKFERGYGFNSCALLEIIWTVVPSIIIFSIAIPSLSLLHSIDEFIDPLVTLKVIGNQWYWNYEYSDYNYIDLNNSLCIDSNLKLDVKFVDLLEVDREIVLPLQTTIRFLITSEDVIHSWAVPSLGIKMDAIPGRLNQVITAVYKTGFFYGQCSELCGIGHYAMPIKIKVITTLEYLSWVAQQYISDKTISLPYSTNGLLELLYVLLKRDSDRNNSINHFNSFIIHLSRQPWFLIESLLVRILMDYENKDDLSIFMILLKGYNLKGISLDTIHEALSK